MRNLFPAPFVLVYSKRFSLTKKRKYVRTKTPLRLNQNVLAFRIKRLCVFFQTYLRFGLNALAFFKELRVLLFSAIGELCRGICLCFFLTL